MAVVQISRIQVRRGQIGSGTGLPQLASGELAWAIDSQELYIGNGAVSEGSPGVGNTKILTVNDLSSQGNILNVISYIYKSNDVTVVTGQDANNPTSRLLQVRLEDTVSVKDFDAKGDGSTDDSVALQRAIDQLFLNTTTPANANTSAGTTKRVVLYMPPGVYVTKKPLYIPSYATIQGAGIEKTKISYNPTVTITGSVANGSYIMYTSQATADMIGSVVIGNGINSTATVISVTPGVSLSMSATVSSALTNQSFSIVSDTPAIRFVNDTSTIGHPSVIGTTLSTNQPRYISMSGLTIETTTGANTGMSLDAVRNSIFENISFKGNYNLVIRPQSIGIKFSSFSSLVTCEKNLFKNLQFEGFTYATYTQYDIRDNTFSDCLVENSNYGFYLLGGDGTTVGRLYGPRQVLISNSKFYNIKKQAIYIGLGNNNTVKDCKLDNVGCDGAGNAAGVRYPQIWFGSAGNSCINLYSDRPTDLGSNSSLSTPYVAEVGGHATYDLQGLKSILIGPVTTNKTFAFALPVSTGATGLSQYSINFNIKYFYKSNTNSFTREGIIKIASDIDNAKVQLADEFEFAGADVSEAKALGLDFSATFLDTTGAAFTGAPGQLPGSIIINYTNTVPSDTGYLTYSVVTSV
jgi:hypothetical protein